MIVARFVQPIDRMAARSDIFDLQCNDIAIPQLAVDREQIVAGYPRSRHACRAQ
jgi:hypothetical protein